MDVHTSNETSSIAIPVENCIPLRNALKRQVGCSIIKREIKLTNFFVEEHRDKQRLDARVRCFQLLRRRSHYLVKVSLSTGKICQRRARLKLQANRAAMAKEHFDLWIYPNDHKSNLSLCHAYPALCARYCIRQFTAYKTSLSKLHYAFQQFCTGTVFALRRFEEIKIHLSRNAAHQQEQAEPTCRDAENTSQQLLKHLHQED